MEKSIPTLHTKSLSLRPLEPADAEVLHRIYQSDSVLKYFPSSTPPPLEKVQRFLARQQAHWEKYGYGNWAIQLNGEHALIGWAGLQYLPELNETEVGFLLDRPFWGRGYATQAGLASVQFGLEQIHLDHIIALVHPDNLASQRVIEKCGLGYRETIFLWGLDLRRYTLENAG